MKGSRKVESNFANIAFIYLIMQDIFKLMNLIFIQKIPLMNDGYFKVKNFMKKNKIWKPKNKYMWCSLKVKQISHWLSS